MNALTVQLDWKPNAQFAGLLFALHRGWFSDAGLNVDIIPWRPATDPLADVAERPGLISVSEDNLAIRAAASGAPVKIIGTMLQQSPLAWMVLEDSPIRGFADFAGRTIGVHVDGVTGLQFAMKSAGLDLHDAHVIDVPYDKTVQLSDGRIEVCQCNGLVEPTEMAHEGLAVRTLWAMNAGYSVYSQVLTTSDDTLGASGAEVDLFTKILWSGWQAVYEDIAGTAEMIIEHFLHETSEAVQREILEVMRPFVFGDAESTSSTGAGIGVVEAQRLQHSIDLLVHNGVISHRIDASDLLR
jgi:ABC-type nitrate/sulfonate/bicarbonate transport system substrate-binding protein